MAVENQKPSSPPDKPDSNKEEGGWNRALSMFAKPGAEEGQLVTTIRLAEDGSIFVNDQQVR